ncbi:MAG: hypothetical protein KY437_10170 [Actinobacteria bacterium]|nr:hypothetical protein [Actinomycetota bacterium]
MRDLLSRLAAGAPVPVFVALGGGARDAVADLGRDRTVTLVDSPRHATILLVAGRMPRSLIRALAQIHDQLPQPRATVWWTGGDLGEVRAAFPDAEVVGPDRDVSTVLRRVHRELVTGQRPSEPTILPDQPPARWRGVGPHGQGGMGMMGGRPYGRPMPMTGPDRDGLELDRLPLRVGPFVAFLPAGLHLDVVLQGDVLQEATLAGDPFDVREPFVDPVGGPLDPGDPFRLVLDRPLLVAELEVARARSHLRWAASAVEHHGLDAGRARQLAPSLTPGDAPVLQELRRRWERNPTLRWAMQGVGVTNPDQLEGRVTGPVARAAGLAVDARRDDPAYRSLGFEPVTRDRGDAWARFLLRLDEVEASLDLAARAGDETARTGVAETPRGTLGIGLGPDALTDVLSELLPGLEWGDAVTTVISFDLDLEHARIPAGVR